VAVVGVVATAGSTRATVKPAHGRSVFLAAGSAAGFGAVLYAMSKGSGFSPVMTMVAMRAASVPLLLGISAATLRPRPGAPRTAVVDRSMFSRGLLIAVLSCGALDVGANLLFGIATTSGALAVVAVLGSLYPAGTVLLARFVDGERMSGLQNSGVVAAVAGVAMIAAGS
jgi:drug/metabolite transporter (DMT)-like permease